MNLLFRREAVAIPQRRDLICRSQSQQDAPGLTRPLMHPKYTMKIGNWNVWILYRSGNIAQAMGEMKRRGIDIMDISETH